MRVLIVVALIGLTGCASGSSSDAGTDSPHQGFYLHGSVGSVFGVTGR